MRGETGRAGLGCSQSAEHDSNCSVHGTLSATLTVSPVSPPSGLSPVLGPAAPSSFCENLVVTPILVSESTHTNANIDSQFYIRPQSAIVNKQRRTISLHNPRPSDQSTGGLEAAVTWHNVVLLLPTNYVSTSQHLGNNGREESM